MFKYLAPTSYKAESITISGVSYEVKSGIVSSNEDIYFALQPLQFSRYVEEPKKAVTVTTAK
ncbi:hypothetical protein AMD27_06945 [Acinetobacter sp. TGL-Y2]|uniref:hypothetical protein n=1 Tax=Acinetobacter sp. TGL-Y2 TaxID=1407071 RepID=UPI0007A64831|nr:hypothetical protein [Acinetobacter sp. TGL-Y2]AMW78646.1 hypothetical protein AMD27_06945 [Acinetobacter sp. TGL-Y2]